LRQGASLSYASVFPQPFFGKPSRDNSLNFSFLVGECEFQEKDRIPALSGMTSHGSRATRLKGSFDKTRIDLVFNILVM